MADFIVEFQSKPRRWRVIDTKARGSISTLPTGLRITSMRDAFRLEVRGEYTTRAEAQRHADALNDVVL